MEMQEINNIIRNCIASPFAVENDPNGNWMIYISNNSISDKELRRLAAHFVIVSIGIDNGATVLCIVVKRETIPLSLPYCYDKSLGILRRTKAPRFTLLLEEDCPDKRLAKIISHAAEYLNKAYKTEGNE